MLFDRDYNILTPEEIEDWEKAERELEKVGRIVSREAFLKYWKDIPPAAVCHKQIFPNNYTNKKVYSVEGYSGDALADLRQILDNGAGEREVLNFIRAHKAYSVITSILPTFGYRFGHHQTFLFKEFELPPNYVVDYLLVGSNSDGYHFVFVELEAPAGQITTNDGEFGLSIRKGIKQVNDWDAWLEANYSSLRLMYYKHLGKGKELPKEFYELDKSRLHYVLVAGRRKDFNENTYRLRRKLLQERNIQLLHYDNILDRADELI